MTERATAVGLIVAVFGVVGVGLGVVGFIGTNWATTVFLVRASGETATRFGPIFVGVVAFVAALVVLFAGPVLGGLLGLLVGSQYRSRSDAVLVTATGGFLGFVVLGVVAGPLLLAGVGGGASPPFGVVEFAMQLVFAAVPSAAVAGVGGAVGVEFAG